MRTNIFYYWIGMVFLMAANFSCSDTEFSGSTPAVRTKQAANMKNEEAKAVATQPPPHIADYTAEDAISVVPEQPSREEVKAPPLPVVPYSIQGEAATYDAFKNNELALTLSVVQTGETLPVYYTLLEKPKHGDLISFDPASGKLVYRARPNTSGQDSLAFIASTSQGESALTKVTFNIVNRPPVLADLSMQAGMNTELVVKLTGSDPDDDSLQYALGTIGEGIDQYSIDALTGVVRLKAEPNFVGSIAVEISCKDALLSSKNAKLTVEFVASVEKLEDIEVSTPMNIPVPVSLAPIEGVGSNAIYAIQEEPAHGTISKFDAATGSLLFTPKPNFVGSTNFFYTLHSSAKLSSVGTGQVAVTVRNGAPVTQNIDVSVDRNQKNPQLVDLAAYASDPDGHALTYDIVDRPKRGELVLDSKTGRLTYLPVRNFSGLDTFSYKASDGVASSEVSTVRIDVQSPISKVKPAVAVRGMGCLTCHAVISSNIVTDFGYGDSFYMGGSGVDFIDRGHFYNNNQNTWQSMKSFKGQLYIPNAPLRSGMTLQWQALTPKLGQTDAQLVDVLKGLQTGMSPQPPVPTAPLRSIEDLLKFPYNNSTLTTAYNSYLIWNGPAKWNPSKLDKSIDSFIEAPAGKASIVVNESINIKAPTSAEILGIVPGLDPNVVSVQAVPMYAGAPVPPAPGFVIVKNELGSYVSNPSTGALACVGDVVVNGPLFLKKALIDTDQNGCRLYVTGSVFIEGGISYVNPANGSNLQISSSRAISMGVGSRPNPAFIVSDQSPMSYRVNINHGFLRGGSLRGQIGPLVLNDAAIVTKTNGPLLDAQDPESKVYDPASFTNASNIRNQAAIEYKALLLNAPFIQSRYLGTFSGTIISELALFAVGHFQFQYDHVFDNTSIPILPMLDSIFLVQ